MQKKSRPFWKSVITAFTTNQVLLIQENMSFQDSIIGNLKYQCNIIGFQSHRYREMYHGLISCCYLLSISRCRCTNPVFSFSSKRAFQAFYFSIDASMLGFQRKNFRPILLEKYILKRHVLYDLYEKWFWISNDYTYFIIDVALFTMSYVI